MSRPNLKDNENYCQVCNGHGSRTETDVEEGWTSSTTCVYCKGIGVIKKKKKRKTK